jgi:acylphosphatase
MQLARRFRIFGQVQGVFFREWTVREAQQLGITGWVRNRSDGSVEVLAIGGAPALTEFSERLQSGPPTARVERTAVEDAQVEPFTGFARRPTE